MSKSGIFSIIQLVGMCGVAVTSTVLNGIIITMIVNKRTFRARINRLLLSLAVSDLLFGAVAIPLHLMADFELFDGDLYACLAANSFQMALSLVSLLLLIAMAVDRLVAITYPFSYNTLVTHKRLYFVILFSWLYGALCAVLPCAGWNNFNIRPKRNMTVMDCNMAGIMDGGYLGFYILGHFYPGSILLLGLYIKILLSTRSHCRRIGTTEQLDLPPDMALRLSALRKNKVTSKLIILLGNVFMLSFQPLLTAFAIDFKFFTVRIVEEWICPYTLYLLGSITASLNPVINPLILGFTKTDVRKSVGVFWRRRQKVGPIATSVVSSCREVTWKNETYNNPAPEVT